MLNTTRVRMAAFLTCRVYQRCLAVILKGHIQKSKRLGIIEIPSVPCIEALLLEILEENVPATTAECKRAMQRIVGVDKLTDITTLKKHFPQKLLEDRRTSISPLDQLLSSIKRKT